MDIDNILIDLSVSERVPGAAAAREHLPAQSAQRLALAVLDEAVRTYKRYAFSGTRRGRRLFGEVEAWFMESDPDVPIAFGYACEMLGINPQWAREQLEHWRAHAVVTLGPSGRAPDDGLAQGAWSKGLDCTSDVVGRYGARLFAGSSFQRSWERPRLPAETDNPAGDATTTRKPRVASIRSGNEKRSL